MVMNLLPAAGIQSRCLVYIVLSTLQCALNTQIEIIV